MALLVTPDPLQDLHRVQWFLEEHDTLAAKDPKQLESGGLESGGLQSGGLQFSGNQIWTRMRTH